jgi:hypothetical protein
MAQSQGGRPRLREVRILRNRPRQEEYKRKRVFSRLPAPTAFALPNFVDLESANRAIPYGASGSRRL